MIKQIYRHFYDNPLDRDGNKKPNELLGEFEIIEGDDNDYSFEMTGVKDGKTYRIIGQEVSFLADRYNAGTKCFIELVE